MTEPKGDRLNTQTSGYRVPTKQELIDTILEMDRQIQKRVKDRPTWVRVNLSDADLALLSPDELELLHSGDLDPKVLIDRGSRNQLLKMLLNFT